jgi:hypothetical protein
MTSQQRCSGASFVIARLLQEPVVMPYVVTPGEPLLSMWGDWEISLCRAAIGATSGGVECVVERPLVDS